VLNWHPVWNIDTTLEKTAEWYRKWLEDANIISYQQLTEYVDAAKCAKIGWAQS